VLGIANAAHQEDSPSADDPLISALSCSLVGKTEAVSITQGSLAHRAYGRGNATEQFLCNYGLSPKYRARIESAGLRITGVDRDGEARIIERTDHPFFIATLFLPQFSSTAAAPHPLIVAFLRAAADFRRG
jgi:CTP synthase (UTP-ammonia lyase)